MSVYCNTLLTNPFFPLRASDGAELGWIGELIKMPSGFFEKNLSILSSRFPALSEKVKALDISKIGISNSADGGMCYAVMNERNEWIPASNYENPIKAAQASLDKMQHRLIGGLSPAVIVGLYPGYILESVFRYFQSRLNHNEPFRHIYIVIDSVHCLAGWLKASDRTAMLEQEELSFHWHENVHEIVELCEKDLQRSHLFIPLSILPENELNKIIAPLAELYLRRKKEEQLWLKENEDYYNTLTDEKLAEIISGKSGRKPRLLMPTHMSSTVVQYSTRDTCKNFEQMGWDTMILKMERDLSPWLIIKYIHDYRPDVMIFINHLRNEHEGMDLYPKNLMFITWIQDAVPLINSKETAERWNAAVTEKIPETGEARKRDLLIGYVEQVSKFGYLKERLNPLNMIVDSENFKPRKLTPEHLEKYGCDVCFASNRGKPVARIVEEELYPILAPCGFSKDLLMKMHNHLWRGYRNGKTFITYLDLLRELKTIDEFTEVYDKLKEDQKSNSLQRIFWILNDAIYRHVVLEWCVESGVKLNLYGKGWSENPYFATYAKGEIAHGDELSIAYQCAKYCLHLNPMEGRHQRLVEIILSGATPLTRLGIPIKMSRDCISGMEKMLEGVFSDCNKKIYFTDPEYDEMFVTILNKLQYIKLKYKNAILDRNRIASELHVAFFDLWLNILASYQCSFKNKEELNAILKIEKDKDGSNEFMSRTSNMLTNNNLICKKIIFDTLTFVKTEESPCCNILKDIERNFNISIAELDDYVDLNISVMNMDNSEFEKIFSKIKKKTVLNKQFDLCMNNYLDSNILLLAEKNTGMCNLKTAERLFRSLSDKKTDDINFCLRRDFGLLLFHSKINLGNCQKYYNANFYTAFRLNYYALISDWNFDGALELCDDIKKIKPDLTISSYKVLGLWRLGKLDEALEVCSNSDVKIFEEEYDKLLYQAIILRTQGKYEPSFTYFEKSLECNARHWIYLFNYALTLFYFNDFENAIRVNRLGLDLETLQDNPSFAFDFYLRAENCENFDITMAEKAEKIFFILKVYFWLPYYLYPMLVMILLLERYGFHDKALGCIEDLVNNKMMICPSKKQKLNDQFYPNKDWKKPEFCAALAESIFPYHPENSFDRLVVWKLVAHISK